ncbi:MAG: hypothetical protein O7G87_08180 [bacterium]|nr:hypothetical protein [bacterium]
MVTFNPFGDMKAFSSDMLSAFFSGDRITPEGKKVLSGARENDMSAAEIYEMMIPLLYGT